jgi:DNA-binding HxlR family transcriptional regulator
VGRASRTSVCPYGASGVGGKWMFWSMYHLLEGEKRFSHLRRLMPEAGRQTLVTQLRALERAGAVDRTVLPGIVPRVEYSLTRHGKETEPILRQLRDWGQWYGDQVGRDVDWLVSLGTRWRVWIVHSLAGGLRRFSGIQQSLPEISNQVLSRELRELAALGFIAKHDDGYTLTAIGERTLPVLGQLHAWGRWMSAQTGADFDWPTQTTAPARQAR